jgi:hypothetical protein
LLEIVKGWRVDHIAGVGRMVAAAAPGWPEPAGVCAILCVKLLNELDNDPACRQRRDEPNHAGGVNEMISSPGFLVISGP